VLGIADHANCPVPLLNVSGMHAVGQQVAVGIGDDMALASLHFFASIESTRQRQAPHS